MHNLEIKQELEAVFCKVLKKDRFSIDENTSFKDFNKWDSVTHMELITRSEDRFKIKFALKELISIKTVGDLISCIESKLS